MVCKGSRAQEELQAPRAKRETGDIAQVEHFNHFNKIVNYFLLFSSIPVTIVNTCTMK